MDFGSIKNVGTAAVDEIVLEREKNGAFKNFSDFAERIKNTQVNKKCVESMIKAGAFDELGQTRKTLLASFEQIIDTINESGKKSLEGQVSMFDLGQTEEKEEIKYNYTILPEFTQKELLSMEKEMLGLYISGHPLENLRHQLELQTTINTVQMRALEQTEEEIQERPKFQDGQTVKYAGIITSVKKKYTKNNTIMAFVTIEDLYGSAEIIVFESCYQACSNLLINEGVVLVEGRLSIREDEETKIVAKSIQEFGIQKRKMLELNITDLTQEKKEKLKGTIKFFTGEKNNMQIKIINGEKEDLAGGIYMTPEILEAFQNVIGEANAKIVD